MKPVAASNKAACSDWVDITLGDCISLKRGHDLVWRDRRPGQVPVMGSAGVAGHHDTALVQGPGVVLGRSGASFGQAHYCESNFWPHNTALYVTNFYQNEPKYIYYLLSSINFSKYNSGGAQQSLNRNFIAPIVVKVPPLSEQRVIAKAIDDVDALLDGLDRLIAKKRAVKQAAMQQLLTGRTRLPEFAGEWESVVLGDVTVIRNVKTLASATPAGTKAVELESIGQGNGRLLAITNATGPTIKYAFKKDDVLFGRLRSYLKKYWLAEFDGVCSTEIWPLMPRDDRLYAGFLHLVVQTDEFVKAASVSYGTHMPRSDWSVLKQLATRLPPVPEQTAIAAVLSDMDAEIDALEARRAKTAAIKQGIMGDLLTGRTRLA